MACLHCFTVICPVNNSIWLRVSKPGNENSIQVRNSKFKTPDLWNSKAKTWDLLVTCRTLTLSHLWRQHMFFFYPLQGVVGSLIFQTLPSVILRWQPETDAALMCHTSVTNTPTFLDSWEVKTQGFVSFGLCCSTVVVIECVPPKKRAVGTATGFIWPQSVWASACRGSTLALIRRSINLNNVFVHRCPARAKTCFEVSALCRLIIKLFGNQMETGGCL